MADKSLPLLGKIAIVTGASRGIGASIALRLAQDGAHLILAFTSTSSEAKAAALASQIEALPHKPRAHAIQADLSTLTGPQHLIDAAVAWQQQHLPSLKIRILVNNAATEVVASLATLSPADYSKCHDTNVRGPILVTQALLPHLPPRARIINLSSVGARAGFKDMGLYSSSKAALEGLTRSWAAELGANGTTVNAIVPGPVETDMLAGIPQEVKEFQRRSTPLEGRFGTVEEVADVAAWLAGESSRWVTGQCINVSGGWQMT